MDFLRTTGLAGVCTLFAQTPDVFDGFTLEKIGFGSLLFLIIWAYLYKVLPKSQEQNERLYGQIAEQQKTISSLCDKINSDKKMVEELTELVKDKLEEHRKPFKCDNFEQ